MQKGHSQTPHSAVTRTYASRPVTKSLIKSIFFLFVNGGLKILFNFSKNFSHLESRNFMQHPHFSPEILQPKQHEIVNPISWDSFRFFLAPLESNTDLALRALCYRYGADFTITEMVRVQALVRKNKSTWTRLCFDHQTPTLIQLLGNQESEIREFLQHFIPPQQFYGFNLNLSCPSKSIVKLGLGCALVKRVAKVQRIIDVFREFQYPICLKIRLGLNALEKQQKVYLRLIQNTTPDFFIVHARHGCQKYIEPADFSIYSECSETGKIIVANGDIMELQQIQYLQSCGIQGAMLGRGAIANPSIFQFLKGAMLEIGGQRSISVAQTTSIIQIKSEYLDLAKQYNSPEHCQRNVLRRFEQDFRTMDQNILQ